MNGIEQFKQFVRLHLNEIAYAEYDGVVIYRREAKS